MKGENNSTSVPTFSVNPATDLVYTDNVTGLGTYYLINPWDCATVPAAQRLLAYLVAKLPQIQPPPKLVFNWPEGAFSPGSPFQQEDGNGNPVTVPYLYFASAVNPANSQLNVAQDLLVEYYHFPNDQADATLLKWLALP